jgi:GNAT superfamily N-acetyltransferase
MKDAQAGSPCQCGFSYCEDVADDRVQHEQYHDWYLHGYPFTDLTRVLGSVGPYQLIDARAGDLPSRRKSFADLAMVACREVPQFKAGYYGQEDEDSVGCRAFAAIHGDRGIALLITQVDIRAWPAIWRGGKVYLTDRVADTTSRHVIQRVWVAKEYRRQGIARALVQEGSRVLGQECSALAWEGPFTPMGRELLYSLNPERFWLTVGDIGDLHGIVAGIADETP